MDELYTPAWSTTVHQHGYTRREDYDTPRAGKSCEPGEPTSGNALGIWEHFDQIFINAFRKIL